MAGGGIGALGRRRRRFDRRGRRWFCGWGSCRRRRSRFASGAGGSSGGVFGLLSAALVVSGLLGLLGENVGLIDDVLDLLLRHAAHFHERVGLDDRKIVV